MVTATGGNNVDSIGVSCTSPAIALGGGVSTTDDTPGNGLLVSAPLEGYSTSNLAENGDTPTGWFAEFDTIGPFFTGPAETVTVYAICTA